LEACRPPPPADLLGGSGWSAACALPHGQGGGVAGRAQDGSALPSNLEIDDPEVTGAGVDRLADILAEGCEAARSIAAGAAEVDRSLLSAAGTSVTLANSLGFRGTYRKSLALLSIAMVPGGTRAGRLSSLGGNVVRPSFRDAPAVGPANLHILPASEVGELLADPLVDPIGERLADQVRVDAGPCLRVTAARFIPGPAW